MDFEIVPANRGGRSIGSRNQRTVFVEALFSDDTEKVKAMVRQAIAKAIDGDVDFAKLIFRSDRSGAKGQIRPSRSSHRARTARYCCGV